MRGAGEREGGDRRGTRWTAVPFSAGAAGLVAALLLGACGDGREAPTGIAEPGAASLAVEATIGPSDADPAATVRDAYRAADSLDLRLLRLADETTVLDRTLAFDPSGERTEVPLEITLEGASEDFLLDLTLRRAEDPLFRGSVDVTLRAGETAEVEVPLDPVPAGLLASPDSLRFIALGDTAAASAAVLFATGDSIPGLAPAWSSTDPQVAESLSDGRFASVSAGRASAVASFAAFRDTVALVVDPTAASVQVTPGSAELTALGATRDFDASITDANGNPVAGATAAWSSTDTEVATVDGQGTATAQGNGEALIVASAMGVADSAELVVQQTVSSVQVTPGSAELTALGATRDFDASITDANGNPVAGATAAWSSTDTEVATVDGQGTATAQGNGEALIVASAMGVADSAELVVQQTVSSVQVTPDTADIPVGDTLDFDADVTDANGNPVPGATVSWVSRNTQVATVDDTGTVIGQDDGSTFIVASSGGVADSADLDVFFLIGAAPAESGAGRSRPATLAARASAAVFPGIRAARLERRGLRFVPDRSFPRPIRPGRTGPAGDR